MARTLDEIRMAGPSVDRAKIDATTEEDIARHMAEDDSAPAAPLSAFVKRRPGERGPGKRAAKVQITLRIDRAALDAWRGSGDGWMGRAADVLAREAPKAIQRA